MLFLCGRVNCPGRDVALARSRDMLDFWSSASPQSYRMCIPIVRCLTRPSWLGAPSPDEPSNWGRADGQGGHELVLLAACATRRHTSNGASDFGDQVRDTSHNHIEFNYGLALVISSAQAVSRHYLCLQRVIRVLKISGGGVGVSELMII